jgi:hypothetical protein
MFGTDILYDTDPFFVDCYKPRRMLPYIVYDSQELLDLKMTLVSTNTVEDFRTTQYTQYVQDGHIPIFRKGNGKLGQFIDLDVNQCARLLCILEQGCRKEDNIIVHKPIVRQLSDYTVEEQDDDTMFMNKDFCAAFTVEHFDRYYHEAKTVLNGIINKPSVLFIPYAGCGASVLAALELGFLVAYFESGAFEWSDRITSHIAYKGVYKCEDYADFVDLDYDEPYFFYHRTHGRDKKNLLQDTIDTGWKVLVCDVKSTFPGCCSLRMTGHTNGYHVSTDIVPYLTCGVVNLQVVPDVYEQLNPHIIARFKQFIFCGLECIPVIKFMLLLDPKRKLRYYAVGPESEHLNKYFKFTPFVTEGPVLYVTQNGMPLIHIVRDVDAVYSVVLKREMSVTYLSQVLPFLGLISVDALIKMGFLCVTTTIPNAVVVDGLICSTIEPVEMQIGTPYIIKNYKFCDFRYDSGQSGTNLKKIIPFVNDYVVIECNDLGFLKYESTCVHPTLMQNDHAHIHAARIVVYPRQINMSWLITSSKPVLGKLPQMFSVTSLRERHSIDLDMSAYAVDVFMRDLLFDLRVRVSADGQWVLNPQGDISYLINDDRARFDAIRVEQQLPENVVLFNMFHMSMVRISNGFLYWDVTDICLESYIVDQLVCVPADYIRTKRPKFTYLLGTFRDVNLRNRDDIIVYNGKKKVYTHGVFAI